MKNHYATLGISPSATAEQIKTAYTNAVLKAQAQPNFAALFAEIQQAYDILSNPVSRKQFDAELLSFYSGKFTNQTTHTPKFESKKESTHKPVPPKPSNVSLLKDIRVLIAIIALAVIVMLALRNCNKETPPVKDNTPAYSKDLSSSDFSNPDKQTQTPATNSGYIPPVKEIPVDPVLQDSINLVNEGYELRPRKNGAEPDCFNYTPRKANVSNKLEVYVGYGTDVAVKLMDKETDNCIRYFYINGGSTYTIRGIPQGVYYLKLAYGSQWMMANKDGQCQGRFLRNARYEIGEETLDYNFRYTSEGHSIPSYRLQLGISHNFDNSDNFRSSSIDERQFNN